ncbi:MAG: ribbon-helix-helix domain-containing protein [Alphaproteobacteria bacterium]
MQDFTDHLTIKISGKTHYAMIAFLKKHGGDSHDLSAFIDDAIRWRILDREMAFLHAKEGEVVELFPRPAYEEPVVS